MIPDDTDYSTAKEEINTSDTTARISKAVSSSPTSSWSRLKDPRIVRVSRAFGGKDRHSKVCTVRGLRDRRVRLSVPTAIQLYDLQDRLGLNQPSKVVDWLLNEAKHAIDELPPLQIPQGSLMSQNLHHPMFMNSHHHDFWAPQSDKGLKINSSGINWGKAKDVSGETSHHHHRHHENWRRDDNHEEERSQLQLDQNHGGFDSSTSSTVLSRQSISFPSLLNASLPYNPFVRWDPSNMTLSHDPQRSHHESSTSQNNEDYHHRHHHHHNFSLVQLPSIPAGSHPVLVYHQPGMSATQSFNTGPSHQIAATHTEFESKQEDFHSLQLSNSSLASPVDSDAQPHVRPFQFSMTANLMPSQNSASVDEQNNNNQFHYS